MMSKESKRTGKAYLGYFTANRIPDKSEAGGTPKTKKLFALAAALVALALSPPPRRLRFELRLF